jgi:hypothetical protein
MTAPLNEIFNIYLHKLTLYGHGRKLVSRMATIFGEAKFFTTIRIKSISGELGCIISHISLVMSIRPGIHLLALVFTSFLICNLK